MPILAAIVSLVPVGFFVYYYNALVSARQLLREAASGVDVQLKRRHDLVPNLVAAVKGYAAHEKNVLEEVSRLRSDAAGSKNLKESAPAENLLTQGIRSLFALVENYPDLKADRQFIQLHENLVNIENELQMSRRYFNGTVRDLNVLAESFPSNIVARIFQFKPEEFFEIETVTEREAPQVSL